MRPREEKRLVKTCRLAIEGEKMGLKVGDDDKER